MLKLAVACAIVLCLTFPAAAKHHHHRTHKEHCIGKREERPNRARSRVVETPEVGEKAVLEKTAPGQQTHRPKRLVGSLEVAGLKFPFTSGGYGWSIPYGVFRLAGKSEGPWGSRHKAIDIADMYDDQIGRRREGMEIHAAEGDTHGCIGVHARYEELRKIILDMAEKGQAWLHVNPDGVRITTEGPPNIVVHSDTTAYNM